MQVNHDFEREHGIFLVVRAEDLHEEGHNGLGEFFVDVIEGETVEDLEDTHAQLLLSSQALSAAKVIGRSEGMEEGRCLFRDCRDEDRLSFAEDLEEDGDEPVEEALVVRCLEHLDRVPQLTSLLHLVLRVYTADAHTSAHTLSTPSGTTRLATQPGGRRSIPSAGSLSFSA